MAQGKCVFLVFADVSTSLSTVPLTEHISLLESSCSGRPLRTLAVGFQVVRLLRSRCSTSIASSFRGSHPSAFILQQPVVGERSVSVQVGCSSPLYSYFSTTRLCREAHLRSVKHLQPAIRSSGIFPGRSNQTKVLVLTLASSYLSRLHGHSNSAQCERGQHAGVTACSVKEDSILELEARQGPVLQLLGKLWVPALVVLTIAMGYQYPVSLLVNLVFLMWSTKPSPSSIYIWVEKRRIRQANEKRSLERLKEKLNPSATVMHVEVRDYMLFCLAKVTSLTQNSTMVGVLGDWWVIYSSSSTITALGLTGGITGLDKIANLELLAKELNQKREELESEGKKAAEDGIEKIRSWCEKF